MVDIYKRRVIIPTWVGVSLVIYKQKRNEMKEWIDLNCNEKAQIYQQRATDYDNSTIMGIVFDFELETDAMAFKLKWS